MEWYPLPFGTLPGEMVSFVSSSPFEARLV